MTTHLSSRTLWAAAALIAGGCQFDHLAGEALGRDGGADAATVTTKNDAAVPGAGLNAGANGGGADAMPAPAPEEEDVTPLGGSAVGWPIAISNEEVATRLARFLWNGPADEALLRFVTSAAPRTNVDVGAIADAMLIDARAASVVPRFYDWWMNLRAVEQVEKDPGLAPWFSPAVAAAMRTQVHDYAAAITWAPNGSLARLLTDAQAPVPDVLLPAFRGAAAGSGVVKSLDPAVYAGIWSLPAPNAILASARYENPVRRGFAVRTRLQCSALPPAPVAPTPIEPTVPGQTTRQRLAELNAQVQCRGCHQYIDPVGFAFGQLDAAGGFRLYDVDGSFVDASGQLLAMGDQPTGSFFGVPGLMKLIARAESTQRCFSAHWLTFARGLEVGAAVATFEDAASLYVRKRAQINGELNLRGVLRAVVETRPFLAP